MVDSEINIDDVLGYIPDEYLSKQMINIYLNKRTKKLEEKNKQTFIKKFYINLFEDRENVNLIPQQYLTEEMIEFARENPEKVDTDSDVQQYIFDCQF